MCARAEAAGLSPGRFLRHAALGRSARPEGGDDGARAVGAGGQQPQPGGAFAERRGPDGGGRSEVLSEVRLAVRGLIRESGSVIAKVGSGRGFGGLTRYLTGKGEGMAWSSVRNLPTDRPGRRRC